MKAILPNGWKVQEHFALSNLVLKDEKGNNLLDWGDITIHQNNKPVKPELLYVDYQYTHGYARIVAIHVLLGNTYQEKHIIQRLVVKREGGWHLAEYSNGQVKVGILYKY